MTQRQPVQIESSRSHVARRDAESSSDRQAESRAHPLVTLQRQVGNATIARLMAQREEMPEEDQLMAKHDPDISRATPEVGLEGGAISDGLSSRIESQRGGGTTLDEGTKATMESRFGDSFDDVRIHTNDEADHLSRSISAKAFTTGTDIFFSQSANPSDSTLMAHELAHVVQQRGSSSSNGPMTVGPAGDSHEQAADAAASAVTSGAPAVSRCADGGEEISREAAPEEEELM